MKKIKTILKVNEEIDKRIDILKKEKEDLHFVSKVKYNKNEPWFDCEIHIDGYLCKDGSENVFDIHVTETEDKQSDTIEGLTVKELTKLRDLLNKIL